MWLWIGFGINVFIIFWDRIFIDGVSGLIVGKNIVYRVDGGLGISF